MYVIFFLYIHIHVIFLYSCFFIFIFMHVIFSYSCILSYIDIHVIFLYSCFFIFIFMCVIFFIFMYILSKSESLRDVSVTRIDDTFSTVFRRLKKHSMF